MPYTTPKLGITVPSPTTRLDRLGMELQQLGESLEQALLKFDYNGVDPNLVLARVAALENTAPQVLYTGSRAMGAGQNATLSRTISSQRNGIICIWSYYSVPTSTPQNSHWTHSPIHKHQLAQTGSQTVDQMVPFFSASGTSATYYKQLVVSDSELLGVEGNQVSRSPFVLRAVVGF